jgi:hypothetical protein
MTAPSNAPEKFSSEKFALPTFTVGGNLSANGATKRSPANRIADSISGLVNADVTSDIFVRRVGDLQQSFLDILGKPGEEVIVLEAYPIVKNGEVLEVGKNSVKVEISKREYWTSLFYSVPQTRLSGKKFNVSAVLNFENLQEILTGMVGVVAGMTICKKFFVNSAETTAPGEETC